MEKMVYSQLILKPIKNDLFLVKTYCTKIIQTGLFPVIYCDYQINQLYKCKQTNFSVDEVYM